MSVRQIGAGRSEAWLCRLVCCAGLCGDVAGCAGDRERLDVLEHEVNQLREQVAKLKAVAAPEPPTAPEADRPLPFKLACPQPLQRYALLGSSLWTCRSPVSSPEGLYPQCNVVFQPQVAIEPRDYFEYALSAAPQLHATQSFQSKPAEVHGAPSFEGSFDAQLNPVPLKALGRLMPQRDITYAVTCIAPASVYANYEPAFRQILDSFEWKH